LISWTDGKLFAALGLDTGTALESLNLSIFAACAAGGIPLFGTGFGVLWVGSVDEPLDTPADSFILFAGLSG
jgi:hypothetical protein